jgi:Lrp/AsnC family transcriptional regulator, leucine-responsive regulatory protein
MDDIDQEILTILQKNARISNKQIADMVHLTPPAVTARIKRMEKSEVIEGYKAVVNAKKLDKAIMARVIMKVEREPREKLISILSRHRNIIGYEHVTGSYSLTIKVLVADIPELERLISKLQQFGTTETLLILSNNMVDQPIYTLD